MTATWTKGNNTQTLTINGTPAAYITRNPLGGWTARRTTGVLIGRYTTPVQAKRAAFDTTRTA